MSVEIVQRRLDDYRCRSVQEEEHALREITQEVALAALGRADFYKLAAFQGGTCLRVFYALNRFSEDLDFILKHSSRAFGLERYLKGLSLEFEAYGYRMEVSDRSKEAKAVQKVLLKDGSLGRILHLKHLKADRSMPTIRIKLEVDTNPPAGGTFESKYLAFPFASEIACQDLPTLLAGKLHALLCREYVKGRDWYDLLFYAAKKTRPNLKFLSAALDQNGPWAGQAVVVDERWCAERLMDKIRALDWDAARADVRRFLKANEIPSLDVWGAPLFMDQVKWLLTFA